MCQLAEFTFKTGNRRGCSNVIRKRVHCVWVRLRLVQIYRLSVSRQHAQQINNKSNKWSLHFNAQYDCKFGSSVSRCSLLGILWIELGWVSLVKHFLKHICWFPLHCSLHICICLLLVRSLFYGEICHEFYVTNPGEFCSSVVFLSLRECHGTAWVDSFFLCVGWVMMHSTMSCVRY